LLKSKSYFGIKDAEQGRPSWWCLTALLGFLSADEKENKKMVKRFDFYLHTSEN
jgi:hypothetical protein